MPAATNKYLHHFHLFIVALHPIVLFVNFHGFAGNLNLCENTTNKAVLNCCQIQIKNRVLISHVGRGGGGSKDLLYAGVQICVITFAVMLFASKLQIC